jgi:hypothetical protein
MHYRGTGYGITEDSVKKWRPSVRSSVRDFRMDAIFILLRLLRSYSEPQR